MTWILKFSNGNLSIDQNTTEANINDEMDKMEAEHEPIIEEVIDDVMGAHTVWNFGKFFCHHSDFT